MSAAGSRWLRWLVRAGVAASIVCAAGGFLHTRAGRPLLARLSGHHCPFARGVLEPARRDALRREGLAAQPHATALAAARPSLGFELGRMDRAQLSAWAKQHDVPCKSESKGAGLACGREGDDALYFRFNAGGTLVGVLSMQRLGDVERASALAQERESALRSAMGSPTRTSGDASATYLASGPLRQRRAEHRFADFSASSSVTNLGAGKYLLSQEAELSD